MNALKTLVFIILVPGLVLLYVSYRIAAATADVAPDLPVPRYPAPLWWLAGGAVILWCAWGFAFKDRDTPASIDPPRILREFLPAVLPRSPALDAPASPLSPVDATKPVRIKRDGKDEVWKIFRSKASS